MNTATGRIYEMAKLYPDERKRERQFQDDSAGAHREIAALTTEVAFSDPATVLSAQQEREELARALAVGKAAFVSPEVAHQVRLGQREVMRRAKRRKAAKKARKSNRG